MALTAQCYSGVPPSNYRIISAFVALALGWTLVGLISGLFLAVELIWPSFGGTVPALSFGRLQPLHQLLVIYGGVVNLFFAISYYVLQRTGQTRLVNNLLVNLVLGGWQLVLLLKVGGEFISLPDSALGLAVNLSAAAVFGAYLLSYIFTLEAGAKPQVYIANWFFLATGVAMLLLSLLGALSSVPGTLGARSVAIQYWHERNSSLFLIGMAGFGVIYYFLPKQSGRPLYSYKLAVVNFWSMLAIAGWTGTSHLQWTAVPDWVAVPGVVASVLLVFPVWAGVLNGLLTVSSCGRRLLSDPVVLFFILALLCYGIAAIEGGALSLGGMSAVFGYTDLEAERIHLEGMGWMLALSCGALYHLAPRLWNTRLYSYNLVFVHLWITVIAIALSIVPLVIAGIAQGFELQRIDEYGDLAYSFAASLQILEIPYIMRALGGFLLLLGFILLIYNIAVTYLKAPKLIREARK